MLPVTCQPRLHSNSLGVLCAENERRAVGSVFRILLDRRVRVRHPRLRAVQHILPLEPVAAEQASGVFAASRLSGFGAHAGAERDGAIDVGVVERARADRRADVPRPFAVARVKRPGRLLQLEAAARRRRTRPSGPRSRTSRRRAGCRRPSCRRRPRWCSGDRSRCRGRRSCRCCRNRTRPTLRTCCACAWAR